MQNTLTFYTGPVDDTECSTSTTGRAITTQDFGENNGHSVHVSTNEASTSPPLSTSQPLPEWVTRYLALLGEPLRPPSIEALIALQVAHLDAVPYETLDIVARRKPTPLGKIDVFPTGLLLVALMSSKGCHHI